MRLLLKGNVRQKFKAKFQGSTWKDKVSERSKNVVVQYNSRKIYKEKL